MDLILPKQLFDVVGGSWDQGRRDDMNILTCYSVLCVEKICKQIIRFVVVDSITHGEGGRGGKYIQNLGMVVARLIFISTFVWDPFDQEPHAEPHSPHVN